ncbi:hypothetical protein RG959_19000 [Domibacillus sp. 8LH]|uniref:DUF7660 family protein n=1 Tax=Domibacillus sp. 8LH TaxID=3073900 RepID=UPI00317F51EC
MELYKSIDSITSREDLARFISLLRIDLQNNKAQWENHTLERYLEAMEAWVIGMDGYYQNREEPMPEQPSWKTVADVFYASSMYE